MLHLRSFNRYFLTSLVLLSLVATPSMASSVLYGVFNTSGTGVGSGDGSGSGNSQGSTLVTVDQATGALTKVGGIGFGRVSGLIYDPIGDTLFATGGNATFSDSAIDFNTQLLAIDRNTGVGTAIGPVNSP